MTIPVDLTVHDALARSSYFCLLDEGQLNALASIACIRRFQAGEMIFSEGEAAIAFYVLLSGQVRVYKLSKEGKEIILHLFDAGALFGEIPIFSGHSYYPANSVCLEESYVISLSGTEFRELIQRSPGLALTMLGVMARKLHHFNGLIEDLSLRTVDSRLAKYLLSVSKNSPEKAVIVIHKKTLAAILGTIPETLSRTFKKLSNSEFIQVKGNHIQVLNRTALIELAGSDLS